MLRARNTKLEGSVENGSNINKNKSKILNKTINSTTSAKSIKSSLLTKARNVSAIDGKKRPMFKTSKTDLNIDLKTTCTSESKVKTTRSLGSKGIKKPTEVTPKGNNTNSFSIHKRGEVPKYLQKAKASAAANIDSNVLIGNRKTFTAVRSRLADAQTEFLKTFTSIRELEKKHSKSIVPSEDYHLIVCVEGNEGKLVLKSEMKMPPFALGQNENCKNDDQNEQLKSYEKNVDCGIKVLSEKLRSIVDNYSKSCQDIIRHPEGQVGDSSGTECVESKLIKSMEDRVSLESLKINESITKILEDFDLNYRDNKNFNEVNDKRIEYECTICELNAQIDELKAKNEIIEKQSNKPCSDKCKDIQNKLIEMQNKIADKDREILKYKAFDKRHEDLKNKLAKDNKHLNEELALSNNRLASADRELQHYKNSSEKNEQLMKELTNQKESYCSLLQVEKDLRQRVEQETTLSRQLRTQLQNKEEELSNTLISLENQKAALLASGDQHQAMLTKEIMGLKKQVEDLEEAKSKLENENEELKDACELGQVDELRSQLDMTFKEIKLLKTTNATLSERLAVMDNRLQERNAMIEQLEDKMSSPEFIQSCTNEVYAEIRRLRKSESEKLNELSKLKLQLSKLNLELKQHEETNFTNKRLLKIRSDLIDSIQEKEASSNCRIEELYTEVVHKDGIIAHINHELNAKTEEIANLLSTLNQKSQELSRKEHATMLLQENVAANQKMRERQVDRIHTLEDHVIDLQDSL